MFPRPGATLGGMMTDTQLLLRLGARPFPLTRGRGSPNRGIPGGPQVKKPPVSAGDMGATPGPGTSSHMLQLKIPQASTTQDPPCPS